MQRFFLNTFLTSPLLAGQNWGLPGQRFNNGGGGGCKHSETPLLPEMAQTPHGKHYWSEKKCLDSREHLCAFRAPRSHTHTPFLSLSLSLSHTHSLSLSHTRTLSLTLSLSHSLTLSLSHSLSHAINLALSHSVNLSHSLTLSLYQSRTLSLSHFLAQSLACLNSRQQFQQLLHFGVLLSQICA